MKFSNREDIEAPIERVFAEITNYDRFELLVQERGAKIIRRTGSSGRPIGWDAEIKLRGKPRQIDIDIQKIEAPQTVHIVASGKSLNALLSFELISLSKKYTRILTALELKPASLNGRLFLQTLRLSKPRLTQGFKKQLGNFAREIEHSLHP